MQVHRHTKFYRGGRWNVWIRCAWATLVFSLLIGCALTSGYADKVPIFLTYWSFFVLSLYHWVALINALRSTSVPDLETPWNCKDRYLKLQWVLFNIANGAAIIVSVMFWTVEYKGTGLTVCSLTLHLFNSVIVLLDIATTTTPVEFRAWKLVSIYGIIYAVFTVIYWLYGGTNHKGEPYIYTILDYSQHPVRGIAMLFVTCFVVTPLAQALLVLFQRLTRCEKRRNDPIMSV